MADIAMSVGTGPAWLDGRRLRFLFDWVDEGFRQLDRPATALEIEIQEKRRAFKSAESLRKRVDPSAWAACDGVGFQHITPERLNSGNIFGWAVDAALLSPKNWRSSPLLGDRPWRAQWGVHLLDVDLEETAVLGLETEFARLTVDDYGYLFYMQRTCGPQFYHMGMSVHGDGRNDEQKSNIGGWDSWLEHFKQPLLRDVYPYNFLSRRYLDLPVHGTTLRGWIEADASRGTLEPLNRGITTWRPVSENIPAIREALFRAGIMFYWRFYVDPSDTHLHIPGPRSFAPDEPIPEIFRADFYAGRDPKLTW
jgi:hypothetical protein